MNDILIYLTSILSGYLVGSISFSRIVTALVSPGTDLVDTQAPVEGTDQSLTLNAVSPTSVRVQLGPRYGLLATFLDIMKVALVVATFRYIFPDSPAVTFAAIGGLLGHNWPLYYKFRGGYGHSAIYGALLVIEWAGIPVNLIGTAIFYYIFRKQGHPALIAGVLILIPWFWFRGHDVYGLLFIGVCAVAYLIRIMPDYRGFRQIMRSHENPL